MSARHCTRRSHLCKVQDVDGGFFRKNSGSLLLPVVEQNGGSFIPIKPVLEVCVVFVPGLEEKIEVVVSSQISR